MERIRFADLLDKGLWRDMGQSHLLGPVDLITVRPGDLQGNIIVRERLKDPLLQDLIYLIRVEAHRFKPYRRPVCFVLKILQSIVDSLTAALIRRLQIGDNDTDLGQLLFAHRNEEIREGRAGNNREVAVADGPRPGILKVGRKFIEKYQEPLFLQEVCPCALTRSLKWRVIVLEDILFA